MESAGYVNLGFKRNKKRNVQRASTPEKKKHPAKERKK